MFYMRSVVDDYTLLHMAKHAAMANLLTEHAKLLKKHVSPSEASLAKVNHLALCLNTFISRTITIHLKYTGDFHVDHSYGLRIVGVY